MLEIANATPSPGLQATAQHALALALMRRGESAPALDAARAALDAAQQAGDPSLVARCLLCLGEVQVRAGQREAALATARRAADGFEALGDAVRLGHAHWLIGFVLARLSQAQGSRAAAERAAALARQTGDEQGLGNALNILTFSSRRHRRAHEPAAAGDPGVRAIRPSRARAAVLGNVALVLGDLGLYRHALRVGTEALDLSRRIRDRVGVMMGLGLTLNMEVRSGPRSTARALAGRSTRRWSTSPRCRASACCSTSTAACSPAPRAIRSARRASSSGAVQDAVRTNGNLEFACLVALAESELAAGRIGPALQASERAAVRHRAQDFPRPDIVRGHDIWWVYARALSAHGRADEAWRALQQAHAQLLDAVRHLHDEGLRRNFLNKVPSNRAVLLAWLREAARRKVPAARRLAHLRIRSNLGEPFKRLVDTGTRLNQLRSAAALHEFLIDEITELTGAERVLLVLDGADGWRIAGAQLPAGEETAPLLQAITPWLQEAGRSRAVSLRHGPAGVPAIDQRSCLVAPLVAQNALLGCVYADLEGAFGRFGETDRDLLTVLAAQAAVALANARWAQALESKVEERTRELSEALEQQTASAEVLRTIGRSVADTQPVFDTILDSCARIFNVEGSIIALVGDDGLLRLGAVHAHATSTEEPGLSQADVQQRAERVRALFPTPLAGSSVEVAIRGRRVLTFPDVINGPDVPEGIRAPARMMGLNYAQMMAPLMRGDEGIGAISLTRRALGPFSAKEQALLKTFADQAVIAIENVRLFNETKEALEQQTATAEVLQGHQRLGRRRCTGVRQDPGELPAPVRRVEQLGIFLVDDDAPAGVHRRPCAVERWRCGQAPRSRCRCATSRCTGRSRPTRCCATPTCCTATTRRSASATSAGRWRSATTRSVFAPLLWEGRGIGSICVIRRPPRSIRRQGGDAAQDLRRPGGDRDPERAAVQGGAGSARRRRGRERGEERVPRDDEPRDPHADERGDRHERPAARHAAQRRAARLRRARSATRGDALLTIINDILDFSKIEAGRMDIEAQPFDLRECVESALDLVSARAAEKHLDIAYVFEGDVPAGDQRRRDAAAPDPAQPAGQRGEVHRDAARSC